MDMETGLTDKVVMITGASGGIGRAIADEFAAEGAQLALLGYRQFNELKKRTAGKNWADRALCVRADMSNAGDLDRAVSQIVDRFGRIDICVANAGIWPPEDVPLHKLSEARIREVVDVNLLGAVWTARAFLAALAKSGPREDGDGASLVFTGSTAGQFGESNHVDYSLSKAGLYGLVRSLKNEIVHLDQYGRVNMVEPGWTVTEMARPALENPNNITRALGTMSVRQLARAKDIARSILFLSSPILARHLSGQIITAAGGMEGRQLWEAEDIDVAEVRSRVAAEDTAN
ncbi:MAG: 3-oxoacyl-[acyl-carrier protein] reductase [Planctomycetota bacterium]|jgi:3-oxoacyl-[acyl-carrier protein] reductase